MNIIQLSEHIFKCEASFSPTKTNILIPNNTWLIKSSDNNVFVIDTAVKELTNYQMRAARALGNPKAIFLTHGHYDHIKGAETWIKEYDIPIYAHNDELVYIKGEKSYPYRGPLETNVANIVQKLPNNLSSFSLPVTYYLTPGHTSGHVIYHHKEDDVLLAGDLFVTNNSKLHPPLRRVSLNMNENIDSGIIIDEIKPKIISTTHGEEIYYNDKLYEEYQFWYRD